MYFNLYVAEKQCSMFMLKLWSRELSYSLFIYSNSCYNTNVRTPVLHSHYKVSVEWNLVWNKHWLYSSSITYFRKLNCTYDLIKTILDNMVHTQYREDQNNFKIRIKEFEIKTTHGEYKRSWQRKKIMLPTHQFFFSNGTTSGFYVLKMRAENQTYGKVVLRTFWSYKWRQTA